MADSIESLVFDLDGVLVDSIGVTRAAFEAAFRSEVGSGEVPFEAYRAHLGRHLPDILARMGLPCSMADVFVRESYRLASEVKVFAGVHEMLAGLFDAQIPMGVATGKSGERARHLLRELDLLSYFCTVVGSDEVVACKPAPDIVYENLRRLGTPAPNTLMVGDSVLDLRAGRAAGAQIAAAMWGDGDPSALRAECPEFVLQDPLDVVGLVLKGQP